MRDEQIALQYPLWTVSLPYSFIYHPQHPLVGVWSVWNNVVLSPSRQYIKWTKFDPNLSFPFDFIKSPEYLSTKYVYPRNDNARRNTIVTF